MPQRGPIPVKDDRFNTYVSRVIPYLAVPANKTRLGVNEENKNALEEALGDTSTAGTWQFVYLKTRNPAIATKSLRDDKNLLKKSIGKRLRAVYADIPKSALTAADRSTLKLPKRASKYASRPAIKTAPGVKLLVQGGARFIIENRVEKRASRPSMHPHAHHVELRYCIQATAPANVDECNKVRIFSKARAVLQLDPATAGQKIHYFTRWANKTSKAKSGPWTRLHSAVISD